MALNLLDEKKNICTDIYYTAKIVRIYAEFYSFG